MILVTGGAGYIGSHCVLALLKNGYDVIIFDNLSTGHIETAEILKQQGNVTFVKGDLNNPTDLENLFSSYAIEAVIHFAASSQVAESMKVPAKYYRNNVVGTLNLLDAMLLHKINKIVFSSTAATYGEPQYTPINEIHPQNPINVYGRTKLMIEKIMDDYDYAYGLKSVRLRYFNVTGADSESIVGEWHDPETHLIPNILKSLFGTGQIFKMFGTDYETRDGTCIRDYIDVEELAQAHILALDYLLKGGNTDVFNLGTNSGSTVKEVFAVCEKVTGQQIPLKEEPRRLGDPAVLVADNQKAKNILKWSSNKKLDDTISNAFNWEKKLQKKLKNDQK